MIFASWAVYESGGKLPGGMHYNTGMAVNAARKEGRLIPVRSAQPGDLAIFDWDGNGVTDHVGLIERNYGTYLQTIEGNTSGSNAGSQSSGNGVWRRTRAFGNVSHVIRPYYAEGGTITGAIVQTTATANRGVKITSAGLQGWNSSGVGMFSVSAVTGSVTVNNGTITGGTLQTDTTGNRGVKIDATNGIRAWDASGNLTAQITPNSTDNTLVGKLYTSRPGTPGIALTHQTPEGNYPGIWFQSTSGPLSWDSAAIYNDSTGRLNIWGNRVSGIYTTPVLYGSTVPAGYNSSWMQTNNRNDGVLIRGDN